MDLGLEDMQTDSLININDINYVDHNHCFSQICFLHDQMQGCVDGTVFQFSKHIIVVIICWFIMNKNTIVMPK